MKHITDSERLTQATLNRKYIEIEQKDREIERLNRIIECKNIQIKEYKNSVRTLCDQIHDLVFNRLHHV